MQTKNSYLWTPKQIKKIERLWKSGKSAREIGKMFGVSRSAIKGVFHRYGITKIPVKQTCESCGETFITTNTSQRKYCSTKCSLKEYRKRNESLLTARQRKDHAIFRKLWGYSNVTTTALSEESERKAAKILETLGYKEVIVTKDFADKFCFDILAKDTEGNLCAFDVTTSFKKTIKRGPFGLLKYLGFVKFYVFHIKSDYSWHCIREVNENIRSSECGSDYRKFLRKP